MVHIDRTHKALGTQIDDNSTLLYRLSLISKHQIINELCCKSPKIRNVLLGMDDSRKYLRLNILLKLLNLFFSTISSLVR